MPHSPCMGAAITPKPTLIGAAVWRAGQLSFDSGEVVGRTVMFWSTAGNRHGTFVEKNVAAETIAVNSRTYDYEGNGGGWLSAAAAHPRCCRAGERLPMDEFSRPHGKDDFITSRKYISSIFCDDRKNAESVSLIRNSGRHVGARVTHCASPTHQAGRSDSGGSGGGGTKLMAVGDPRDWPAISPPKPELVGHFAPEIAGLQPAACAPIRFRAQCVFLPPIWSNGSASVAAGNDTMPQLHSIATAQ